MFGGNRKALHDLRRFHSWISTTFTTASVVIPSPRCTRSIPIAAFATRIGDTDLNLGAVADVNGTLYAFNGGTTVRLSRSTLRTGTPAR